MIGIVCVAQIELSPFVKKYIAVLEKENVEYEIIHWNRSGVMMPDDNKNHTFSRQLDRYGSLVKKALPFFEFRNYIKKIIREKRYEKLIVLTTQTAVIIFDLLWGKYKNKYFFDYRDTSYEYIKPYKKFIDRIIMNSYCTCVSSPGFKEYLTEKKELVTAHNFQDAYYESRTIKCHKNDSNRIIMGYIGYLREYEYLKRFVSAFGKDTRFEFHIYGSGDCLEELRKFASQYDNVKVAGQYEEKNKMNIIDTFDMICYNYPYSFVNYPAVANKFYDGLIRKKPMFGNIDTFSGRLVTDNGLGISLHENDINFTEKIYSYYHEFSVESFESNCEKFLKKVIDDDKYYLEKIKDFIKS